MKKSLLLVAGLAFAAIPSMAQKLGAGYVTWPTSEQLHTYVQAWNGGQGNITIDGKTWEDANFFISRVKPKTRFYNTATQVYPSITQWTSSNKNGNDKRLAFWVPISDESRSGVKLNALPDGSMDGEVFSMWSYVDNYGNWNAPFGWTPGAFSDVAHKNGVSVHGVAGIPNSSISASWKSCLEGIISLGADKVGKFLYYFGQDGLGYNSEFSGWAPKGKGLTKLHTDLMSYMADKDPLWEVMWYNATLDDGGITWDCGLDGKTELFKGSSAFQNYNWNSVSYMNSAISKAENMGRSPFYIYAGMNTQGGEPKSGSNYDLLKDYKYSIGLWGAHNVNMYWQDRNSNGSSPMAKAATYQKTIERWFGNGPRNPAIKKDIKLNRTHRPTDDWAGMSSMMSARSTLSWDLKSEEPFFSYFNLGNGQFFNWKGERMHSNGWYNIGVQDYLPTWRFWFAPTWMGGRTNTISESDVHMDANFTWEDAYVGGSCLKITGTATSEYLHLFKTGFTFANGDKIRVIYKILGGNADIDMSFNAASGSTERAVSLVTKDQCQDVEDNGYNSGAAGWTVAELKIPFVRGFSTIGLIGMHFKNAENLELLLGGLEIVREGASWEVPATPVITNAKILAYNNSGVDAKIIWDMNSGNKIKAIGEPCYNSDVKTSMFRLWAQQESGEPQNMGITTSWAGLIYAAHVDADGSKKMRVGVSALSLDTKSESEIAWSDYMTLPEYVTIEDIQINKPIIKPGEKFELSFIDPLHASGSWSISDTEGNTIWSGTGRVVECPGLNTIGSYNLTVTSNGKTVEYPRYVSISSEAVGALPEIYSLAIDGDNVDENSGDVQINVNERKTFSYTGRPADGSASRGIDLNENWFGVQCSEVGLVANKSFSVAAWVKYNELPTGLSSFITIENRTAPDSWPYNNWGYFWSRINEEGRFVIDKIDTSWGMRMGNGTEGQRLFYRYDDAKIDVGAWTHIAICFEYKEGTNQMRQHFYINGKKQMVSQWCYCRKDDYEGAIGNNTWSELVAIAKKISGAKYGTNTYEPDYVSDSYPITNGDWITFGGTSQEISAVKGGVDDFQIWGKAMTDDDVLLSMNGLDKNNLPADVLGFWDLEEAPVTVDGNQGFVGACGANATQTTPMAYWYSIGSGGENDNKRIYGEPTFLTGCPFISGTASPVVTKPTWTTRRANIVGDGTGEAGSATLEWTKEGDYAVQLKLENGHGSAVMDYPVIKVGESTQGIEEIGSDADGFVTYTVGDALFVEFDADGSYSIEVYNMAGMLAARKSVDIVAGQNVSIALGAQGVYLVKVVRDGQLLRTVKVIRK